MTEEKAEYNKYESKSPTIRNKCRTAHYAFYSQKTHLQTPNIDKQNEAWTSKKLITKNKHLILLRNAKFLRVQTTEIKKIKINEIKGNKRPIQHSILAQGDIFITSGGSTLMFKHNTRATHPVFICTTKLRVKIEHTSYQRYNI